MLFLGADYPALTQPIANLAYWLPPLGWTLYALGISPSHGLPHDLVPCVISAALLAVAPFAYRRIRQDYTVGEESTAAQRPSPADNAVGYPELARRFASSLSDIKTAIQDAQFRSGPDWSRVGSPKGVFPGS